MTFYYDPSYTKDISYDLAIKQQCLMIDEKVEANELYVYWEGGGGGDRVKEKAFISGRDSSLPNHTGKVKT